MADNTMWDVFLSYSMPEDENVVEKIAANLETQGVSCWYAQRDHKHGLFPMAIMQAIAKCQVFVLVLTEHSNKSSGFIAGEVHAAFTRFLTDDSFDIQVFRLDECELDSKGLNLFLSMFPRIDGGLSSNPDVGTLNQRIVDFLRNPEQKQEIQCQTENLSKAEQTNILESAEDEVMEEGEKAQEEIVEGTLDALQQEAQKAEEERKKRVQKERKPKRRRTLLLTGALVALIAICIVIWRFLPSIVPPTLTPIPIPEPTLEELQYQRAETLAQKGDKSSRLEAAMIWGALGDYTDPNGRGSAKERSFSIWEEYRLHETLSAGNGYTVGVFRDSRADSVGDERNGQGDISEWNGIMSVSAGENHTVGLRENGAVIGVGRNLNGLFGLNWSEWKDIVAVSAGDFYTAALRKDGRVLYVNNALPQNTKPPQPPPPPHYGFPWSDSDFVAISAGGAGHTVGLHANGTVEAIGNNAYGRCDVKGAEWNDIVAVSAGYEHTVGLHRNGTVIAVGFNDDGQCNVGGWFNIVAISAGGYHTVGLDKDGNVYATGQNEYGQCDVSEWENVVAISAGWGHTVGLTREHSVLFAGYEAAGIDENHIPKWNDIRFPNE